ncbi:MAG: hypothetical protein HFE45_12125 [Oscillospiraceae bacterium]|jgi:phosphoesterase RecJ-like protein|nr:hypothetical protein [Oscillospiraceae bacterium]
MEKIKIEEAAARLLKMDQALILCHRNPDGDTMGCGYGLCRALRLMGKQARVACHDPIPGSLAYMADGLEEQAFQEKCIISVDVADAGLLGDSLAHYAGLVDLAIDHHESHRPFAKALCLDGGAAAACEIVYEILLSMGAPITKEVADCLYTGIATDTGCFKYTNVTPHTHRAAAALIEAGCDFGRINKVQFDTKSLALLQLEQKVLAGLEMYEYNRIAVITVTREMLLQSGLRESELYDLAGVPRQIEGVDAGVTIKERGDNDYKISLRTSEALDASAVCARFGGGGHKRAGGCSFSGPLTALKPALLQALREALPQREGSGEN